MSWQLLVDVLSWAAMGAGSFILLVTGLGVLTLPDYYSRIHAASITDTLGAALVLFGLALQSGVTLVTGKLLMVLAFLLLTGPMAAHSLAKAAQIHGIPLPPRRDEKSSEETRPSSS